MPLNPNITQWITLKEGDKLMLHKLLLMWDGGAVIGPSVFMERKVANEFQKERKITRYMEVPDPRIE